MVGNHLRSRIFDINVLLLLQDEITASTHRSNPDLEVCQFSMLQLPESQKWRLENRKPVKNV